VHASRTAVNDPFRLQRFVDAQAGVFDQVLAELQSGYKRTHWMWFIFPQIAGLGRSETAQFYAISGRGEAEAYLQHPLLGDRLRLCTEFVNRVTERTVEEIFGYPDDLKFHSCLTLFAAVAPDEPVFKQSLERHFEGNPDQATLRLLRSAS
jgi:uncharacterized protein (DUF1810 family)